MDLPIDEMSKKGIAPPYVPEMQKKKKRKVSFVRYKDILTKKNFFRCTDWKNIILRLFFLEKK